MAATFALDEATGSVLTERLATRSRAVTALADALRGRAVDLARLEPDLDRRVDGLVWAEVAFAIDPSTDVAALGELARRLAPGTLNPDGAPRRTEIWTRDAFLAEYAAARGSAPDGRHQDPGPGRRTVSRRPAAAHLAHAGASAAAALAPRPPCAGRLPIQNSEEPQILTPRTLARTLTPMRPASAILAVAAALACAPTAAGGTINRPPTALVLEVADVPSDLAMTLDRDLTRDEVARSLGEQGGAALADLGYRGGRVREFKKDPQATVGLSPTLAIQAVVALFGSASAAHDAFSRTVSTIAHPPTPAPISGIGVAIEQSAPWTITSLVPGQPAERAGLRPGDRIKTVDGKDVSDLKLDALLNLVRGPTGSTVVLVVLRGNQELTFSLTRATFTVGEPVPAPSALSLPETPGDEAAGFQATRLAPDGSTVAVAIILFRSANAANLITASGVAGSVDAAFVRQLAKRQAAKQLP